jgi:signal transduction histidine kinase
MSAGCCKDIVDHTPSDAMSYRAGQQLLLALLCCCALTAEAAEQRAHMIFEQAEYVVDDSRRIPPDSAPWHPVTLPDNWHARNPDFRGTIWYRIRFDRVTTNDVHALYLPRMSAEGIRFMINGIPFGTTSFRINPNLTELQQGSIRPIPTHFIKPEGNVMHIRVTGDAAFRQGLSRLHMGAGRDIIPLYRLRDDLQRTAPAALGAMLLVLGLVALVLWRMDRKDPILFWFAFATLTGSVWILQMVWPLAVDNASMQNLSLFVGNFLFVPPVLVLCRRVAGKAYAQVELALWLLFLAGCLAAIFTAISAYPLLNTVASVVSLILLAGALTWIAAVWWRARRWQSLLLALAMLVLVALTGHDLGRWMGYVDYDNMLMGPYTAPFLLLALGITILSRYLEVARTLTATNEMLEQRVREKIREAESAHRKIQEVMRDQAVLRERQRLMADMHDGLGSNLVGLLGAARSGQLEAEDLARQLDDTMRDLYAIVDSLQPVEGDLGVVLGNIRYRMLKSLDAAGIRLAWEIAELPTIEGLTPEVVLAIQRIVLEVLSNAIRHSRAQVITMRAWAGEADGAIRVELTDDGAGFNPDAAKQGHGLRNMRVRAERAGIELQIRSAEGAGTTVTLTLPASFSRQAAQPAPELPAPA